MTQTIAAGGTQEDLADRYDRLQNCAEILAADPAVDAADPLCNSEAIRAYVRTLVDARILDGLSEHDADTVGMLVTLDFLRGPGRMVWRLNDWLKDNNSVGRTNDNTDAVCAVLAEALYLYLGAFAGPEFIEARASGGVAN